jgi:hypothetical protein
MKKVLISNKFDANIVILFFGRASFGALRGAEQTILNSVRLSATSPRQVPLSLHMAVGFSLLSFTRLAVQGAIFEQNSTLKTTVF